MADVGGYVWFVGLGAGIVILAIAIAYATLRKPKPVVARPNAAWEQAAAEAGDRAVARQPSPD